MKNYRTDEVEELPLTGEELVRRFVLHILPAKLYHYPTANYLDKDKGYAAES